VERREAGQQINRLRKQIERHDRLYYREAGPEISDEQYDALVRRLRGSLPTVRPLRSVATATPGFRASVIRVRCSAF